MKLLLILLTPFLLTSVAEAQMSVSKPKVQKDMWVSVMIDYSSSSEYIYTKISQAKLNGILRETYLNKWIEFNNCHWCLEDGSIKPVEKASDHYKYGNTYYVKTELIARIVPVSEEYAAILDKNQLAEQDAAPNR
jgi:hypothetical protein